MKTLITTYALALTATVGGYCLDRYELKWTGVSLMVIGGFFLLFTWAFYPTKDTKAGVVIKDLKDNNII
jgi:predicted MFS family arabinose efflux permease